jgi:hypothetical protein
MCLAAALIGLGTLGSVSSTEDEARAFVARVISGEARWGAAMRIELQQAFKGGRLTVAEMADVIVVAQALTPEPTVTASAGSAAVAAPVLQGQPTGVSQADAGVDDATADKAAAVLQDILGEDAVGPAPIAVTALTRRDGQFMVIVDAGAKQGLQVNQGVAVERDGRVLATGVVVKVVDANAGVLLSGDAENLEKISVGDQITLGQ